jgi:DNA-binding transcriptional LysR family regulator
VVDGRLESFALSFRLQANNGDVLAEAAAQGMGITIQPDFIAADYLAAGRLETVLDAFAPPPWASMRCSRATATCPRGAAADRVFVGEAGGGEG